MNWLRKTIVLMMTTLVLIESAGHASALGFTGRTGNEATFETMSEAHAHAPEVVATYSGNEGRIFVGHPALEDYPEGTTYVYRSANMYGGRAASRMNTNLVVCVDQHFADRDDAYAYLQKLGLIDLIDEATGSIILLTPIGDLFDARDAQSYYALQTAMFSQKEYAITNAGNAYYAEAEYFGGYGYLYVIGLGGGATFFNNYIAPQFDFASRIAGAFLSGGDMDQSKQISCFIPVYLLNATEEVVERYKQANHVDALKADTVNSIWYASAYPLQRVAVAQTQAVNLRAILRRAYDDFLIKAMRVPVGLQGLYSIGTPYCGYTHDESPYSLNERHAIFNGKTQEDIVLISHQGEQRFSALKEASGEYIDSWYEYLPGEVLNGSAAKGTIPLILCLHGSYDDGRLFVDEMGMLSVAGKERVALVAPDHQNVTDKVPALTELVEYMLQTYPALDASRVYVMGYSYGGQAAYALGSSHPELFAAIAPMAATDYIPDAETADRFASTQVPIFISTSSYDERRLAQIGGRINDYVVAQIQRWAAYNQCHPLTFDFDAYPLSGFQGDAWTEEILNGEYQSLTWYVKDQHGTPVVALNYVKGLIHALYPQYGWISWNYMKQFSKNLETGEIIYSPDIEH